MFINQLKLLSVVLLGALCTVTAAQPTITFGQNTFGQLGDGTNNASNVPVHPSNLNRTLVLGCGWNHGVVADAKTGIWTWGKNSGGQLGNGGYVDSTSPISVLTGDVDLVSGGFAHGLAMLNGRFIVIWGSNDFGQLGLGDNVDRLSPIAVTSLAKLNSIAAGSNHTVLALLAKTVVASGRNNHGQLGDGTTTDKNAFQAVPGLTNVSMVAAGDDFSMALKFDGTVWCWGKGLSGQLGSGSTSDSLVPIKVPGLTGVKYIAAGLSHAVAIKTDGSVWCWGNGADGALGDGLGLSSAVPVQVTGITNAMIAAGGGHHTLILKADNTVWAWGRNTEGQLGNGSNISSNSPVNTGITGAVTVSAGENWSMVLKSGVRNTSFYDYHLDSGQSSLASVTLNAPAPAGGVTVNLSSNVPGVVTVPATVFITEGTLTSEFSVVAGSVSTLTAVTVTAELNGASMPRDLDVAPVKALGLSLNPATVVGGKPTSATVTINAPAPAGGSVVALSDNKSCTSMPAAVTVAAGHTTANFTITTTEVLNETVCAVKATLNSNATASLTVIVPLLSGVSSTPSTVIGGSPSTGLVTLSRPAPAGGASVTLAVNQTCVSLPASVMVPEGSTSANFAISTTMPTALKTAKITASYSGAVRFSNLVVQGPLLSSVTLNPTSVIGGQSATGTIHLSRPSPPGGVTVAVSSNLSFGSVPSSVFIAAGLTSQDFTITTTAPPSDKTAKITTTLDGTLKFANLLIKKP